MKLRSLARSLGSAYLIIAALLFAAIVGSALVLWQQGIVDAAMLRKIGKILRREPSGDEVIKKVPPEEFARDVERMTRKADEAIRRRWDDLKNQEAKFKLRHDKDFEDRLAELKVRAAEVETREKAFEAQIADREAVLRADELARSSRNFKLDLDLLSRLDPKDAATMLKQMWEDKQSDRVILLIRSMRSRVAGDIYTELLKLDPKIGLEIQQILTEGPGLSPSEVRRLAARLADWDREDLVALLRQMAKPEQEAILAELKTSSATLAEELARRLSGTE